METLTTKGIYAIKCDDCKVTIGETDSMQVSAAGGQCANCAPAPRSEATSPAEYPDRIWLKQTHDQDGWQFGYYADRPQDDAFVEYVRADALRLAGE